MPITRGLIRDGAANDGGLTTPPSVEQEAAATRGACCGPSLANAASTIDQLRVQLRAARLVEASTGDPAPVDAIVTTLLTYVAAIGGDEAAAVVLADHYQQTDDPDAVLALVAICQIRYTESIAAGLSQTAARWLEAASLLQTSNPSLYTI